jgi:hypothetical protein
MLHQNMKGTDNNAGYKQQRKRLRQIIKETTGLNLKDFGEQYLDSQYMALSYRIRHGVLRLEEYHTICFYTGKTFEELWPNPHIPQARKISLKLNHQTLPSWPSELDHLPLVDVHERHKQALKVSGKAPKKEPIPSTTVEDLAPVQEYATVSHNPNEGQKKGGDKPLPDFIDPYEGLVPPDL